MNVSTSATTVTRFALETSKYQPGSSAFLLPSDNFPLVTTYKSVFGISLASLPIIK
jgi:hypothetical protein